MQRMSSSTKPQTIIRPARETPADPRVFSARIAPGSLHFEAPASLTVLQAAEQAGLAGRGLQSSCRNGSCRSCICLLLAGQVSYSMAWPGLSAEEKQGGWILPCVAYPASDLLIQLPV